MVTAFGQWTNASCPTTDMNVSKVSIDVRALDPVACHKVEYNQNGGNANIIMFDDAAWPYSDSNNTLGLTTVTYNINTGELYDADMEINTDAAAAHRERRRAPRRLRLPQHHHARVGALLGMAHSQDTHATMYAHYTQVRDVDAEPHGSDDVARHLHDLSA